MAEDRESIRRWDDKRRDQFGFTNNLLIGLAIATLGFACDLAKEQDFKCERAKGLLLGAIRILALSLIPGIGCTLSRLHDFRLTAKIANMRTKNKAKNWRCLQRRRWIAHRLGKVSWWLLHIQMVILAWGFLELAGAFADAHRQRLLEWPIWSFWR